MNHQYLAEEQRKLEFVERAAKCFADRPDVNTYSDEDGGGDIVTGSWFAVRWGLDNDCVLLLRLHETEEPVVYGQAIREHGNKG